MLSAASPSAAAGTGWGEVPLDEGSAFVACSDSSV